MSYNSSIAASLSPEQRKQLFLEMQSSTQTKTAIAQKKGVSRKFLYQQQQKGNQALEFRRATFLELMLTHRQSLGIILLEH